MNATRGVLYGSKPAKGTFVGVDIETTSNSPDRGYIINVGWETMELVDGAEAHDGESYFCGIPEQYEEEGVPLAEIHKIEHVLYPEVVGLLAADRVRVRENGTVEILPA